MLSRCEEEEGEVGESRELPVGDLSRYVGSMLANSALDTLATTVTTMSPLHEPGDRCSRPASDKFVVNLSGLIDIVAASSADDDEERRTSRRPYSYYMATQFHPVDEENVNALARRGESDDDENDTSDAERDVGELKPKRTNPKANTFMFRRTARPPSASATSGSSSSSFNAYSSFTTLPRRFVEQYLNKTATSTTSNQSTRSSSLAFIRRLFPLLSAAARRAPSSTHEWSHDCSSSADDEPTKRRRVSGVSTKRLGLHRLLFGTRDATTAESVAGTECSAHVSETSSLLLLASSSANTCSSSSGSNASSASSSSTSGESTSSRSSHCVIEIGLSVDSNPSIKGIILKLQLATISGQNTCENKYKLHNLLYLYETRVNIELEICKCCKNILVRDVTVRKTVSV